MSRAALTAGLLLALAAGPGAQAQQDRGYPSGLEGLSYPDAPPEGLSYPSGYEDPRVAAAEARHQEQDILGTIDRIDRQLHGLAGEVAALQRQLDGVEARRMQAEDTLTAAEASMAQEATLVAARCRALYRLARQGLARVLFGAESPVDLRRRTHYLLAILEHDRKRVASFVRTVEQREATLEQVDRDRATVAALQAELRLKEAGLRDERARKLTLLQQVRERKELATRVLAEQDRAQLGLQQASQAQLTTPAVDPSTNASFRASHGALPWPTTGSLQSGFGWVTDPVTGQTLRSNGVKIAAAYGTPFRAVFPGVVKQAGFIRGYGQTVVLDHGAYTTVYAHANGLKVSAGQSVDQGEVLGFVGNSGLVDSSGYLLHFEIRYNGTPQDPVSWLAPQR
jgi:murein DD-endopeptidase MepM/ murein hydrolase activator NlpD